MVIMKEVLLLILQFLLVEMLKHEKPVAELKWRGHCTQNARALNDCNWCRCDDKHKYTCDARNCGEVDMFGHFNDVIRDMDPGMEGHGAWRSRETACEPGVRYQRDGLLCVCKEDGTWPNPVCRDVFRILHSVEVTGDSEVTGQQCAASKLYLVGCNACLCPSTERLDPELCTKEKCSEKDPVLNNDEEKYISDDADEVDDKAVEIYAECRPEYKYKLGCKTCNCLRNNRLHCGNCTSEGKDDNAQSFCQHVQPGQTFSQDCNLCYCDKKGFAYCTSKKCLPGKALYFSRNIVNSQRAQTDVAFDEDNCIPGQVYKRDCNECYCLLKDGKKFFGCTLKQCARTASVSTNIQMNCVKGTVYELNCLICHCNDINGFKTQLCHVNPKCSDKEAVRESRTYDLDSLHGYCEPFHIYTKGCNKCNCLSDGKTVKCTSYVCDNFASQKPVAVEIVPVAQKGSPCTKGRSYKVDCNLCFCLSNGNAICTTAYCGKKKRFGFL